MKKLIAVLLIFLLVTGLIVVPVSANSQSEENGITCPHCGVAWDSCGWESFDTLDLEEPVPSGHYYLTQDTETSVLMGIGAYDGQSREDATDVVLDLRGYSLKRTSANTRFAYVYDYSCLSVMDSVGGGSVSGNGNVVGGTIYIAQSGQFRLYSGTLTNTSAAQTKNGAIVYGTGKSEIYIYGGTLDATNISRKDTDDTPCGGCIYASGICEISGGMFLGGYMYRGGAIYNASTGTMTISDGTIYGGRAEQNGGNICNYGDLYITGGKILGGTAASNGGNVYSGYTSSASNLYSDLFVSGGYIADGQASSNGSNVSVNSGYGSFTGGTVKGNVQIAGTVTLSGNPVIDNYGYEGIYLSTGKKLVIKDLGADARIVLRGSGEMTESAQSPDVATYLADGRLIPGSRYALTVTNGILNGSQDNEGYCPHCEKNVTWTAYTPSTNTSGHYYTASGGFQAGAEDAARTIPEGVDIVINMAHSTVKTEGRYKVDGSLTLLTTATNTINFYNTKSSTDENGTALFVTGTLNFYDGGIKGITTSGNGGAVYVYGGTFNMYGGMITGGTATNGGNLYAYNTGTKFNMYGGVIKNGHATNSAGNVYVGTATFNMYDGVIAGGSADSNGGNVQAGTSGTVYFRNGLILGGQAYNYGGNFYTASTSSKYYMYDGIMMDGTAKNGGNIYFNNGIAKLTGGTVQGGVATGNGGNIYNNNGKYYIDNAGDVTKNYMTIDGTNVIDGKATTGGNLYLAGIATLGAGTMAAGKATSGKEIYFGKVARLTVEPDFTSPVTIYAEASRITQLDTKGAFDNTTCTELNAEMYVENYGMAMLVAADSGKLGLAGAALMGITDGSQQWFKTAQDAADACTPGQYMKLFGTGHSFEISSDIVLDINGADATVTGSGKIYGFDSSNDTYKTFGTLTLSGVTAETVYTAPSGYTYVALTDGGKTSFHRAGLAITDVVLRPSVAGIYYKAQFLCDDTLAAKVDNCGIAVSLVDDPTENFTQDADTLYSAFNLAETNTTSVMVANIFKGDATPNENKSRGEELIFAKAYMQLNLGGETVTVLSADTNPWSMETILQHLHNYWPTYTEARQTAIMDYLYTPYISAFDEDWGLFYMRYTLRPMTAEEEAILQDRRQTVLDYMRSSLSVLWTPTETLTYGLAARDNGTTLKLYAGRIYQGLPYSYAVGTEQSFLEYSVGQDERGIHTIANLEATAVNYESYGGRVGNDCSGALTNAWSQVGTSFTTSRSSNMTEQWGAIPVGDYDFCPELKESGLINYTGNVTKANGEQRIYEAYADLMPADAVFYVATSGSNHVRMVSEVHVVRNADGTINGESSYIIVLEQTRSNQNAVKTKQVEGIGTVYVIGGVDVKYTFAKLFSGNYIPCTIRELRDPTPVEETWITDTQVNHTAENIFEGSVISNRYIDCVTVAICDMDGNVIQSITGRAKRGANKNYQLSRFLTEKAGSMIGSVDLSLLESGQYRCVITARLTIGEEHVVRDFTFTK